MAVKGETRSSESKGNRKGSESTMKVRPLADRILVKREEPSETVRGGIIIPDTAKEKPRRVA